MQASPIRILLANHLPIIRSGLRFLLDREPLVSGIEVAKQITSGGNNACALFVTDLTDESYVHEAFKAGARGYVAGDAANLDLPRAVRTVGKQQFYLSPSICGQLLQRHVANGNISERDRDLWCLIAAGHDEKELSSILQTSAEEIRKDVRSLQGLICRNSLPEALSEFLAAQWNDTVMSTPTRN
jgi:DNA-binding NarL/FixJ family response regulator